MPTTIRTLFDALPVMITPWLVKRSTGQARSGAAGATDIVPLFCPPDWMMPKLSRVCWRAWNSSTRMMHSSTRPGTAQPTGPGAHAVAKAAHTTGEHAGSPVRSHRSA